MSKAAELAALIANVNKGSSLANKNFIINGAAQVQQRDDLSIVSGTTNEGYGPDRFLFLVSNTGELDGTLNTVTDAPDNTGLVKSIKWTTTTPESTSVAANDLVSIRQKIEAQNLQVLEYGTSDARHTTLSFWVKASIAGTYGFTMYSPDPNRTFSAGYTISSTGTWEYKTITIPPDTSGAINNDNGEGLRLIWQLGVGSTYTGGSDSDSWRAFANNEWNTQHTQNNIVLTDNATFQITGVQLEIGEKATEFEIEPYAVTLYKAQRYYQYQDIYFDKGTSSSSTDALAYYYNTPFTVFMRQAPTLSASAINSNSGNATTRHGTTVVDGWVLSTAYNNSATIRGNHTAIWNYIYGRAKWDAEL